MKLHRKLAGLVSAAVVLSSLSVGAFAASPSDFADMPSDWSRPALENAINNGLLNGSDGKINASGLLTRAELAAIVNRAFGATKTADISSYTDVPASAWYYADMQKAVHMGTFEGSNGKLSPASAITRQEAFTVLARAFSLADGSASSLSKFSDASAVSSWAKGPVAALTEAGYVNGSGGKLNPTASITRAEFAQIADNLVSAYLPKEYTGTADGNAMVREAGAVLDKADIKGDLILGDGVGDGNVTIRDSKVSGRLVVRGGGVHSIIISGSTEIGTVVVSKVDGNVRVATEGNAKVQTIVVDDGKDDVIIEGTVGKVEIASANVPVVLQNAKVDEVVVSAAGADVTVDKNSTVKTVTVDSAAENTALTVAGKVDTVAIKGDNATVTAEKGATIAKVQTAAANTEVKGDGKVTKVEAQAGATGAKVTTPGTSITVDKGADAVKTDKGTVEPGKTGSTSGTTTGGGGGGGGGSSTTTETLEGYLPAPLADGAVTDYKVDVTKTSNRDYIDVKVSGKDLTYSLNSDTTYHINGDTAAIKGLWAGFAVPVPEKADAENTKFSWTSGSDWKDAQDSALAFMVIDDKSYMVFYSDLSKEAYETRLQIVWADAEGNVLETQKFLVDYSGVATKDEEPEPIVYYPAPLDDGMIKNYAVTAEDASDHIKLSVSGADLQYQITADAKGGFWAGVAIPVPEHAVAEYTKLSLAADDWTAADADLIGGFDTLTGVEGNFVAVYSDLSEAAPADHLQIVWKDADDKEIATQKFLINFSGVTLAVNDVVSITALLDQGREAVLSSDTTLSATELQKIITGKKAVIDLNDHTLTVNQKTVTLEQDETGNATSLTLKNGKLKAANATSTSACFNILTACAIELDRVEVTSTGSVLFPQGDAASVTVTNSSIDTSGVYGIATNSGDQDNFGVKITVENSSISTYANDKDTCAVLINVPGTLNLKNSQISGQRQGLIVRAGTVVAENCTIDSYFGQVSTGTKYYGTTNWSSGNEVPYGAVVIGKMANTDGTAYADDTSLTLTDCTLSCRSDDKSLGRYASALYAVNKNSSYKVTINGSSTVKEGNVVYITSDKINGSASFLDPSGTEVTKLNNIPESVS